MDATEKRKLETQALKEGLRGLHEALSSGGDVNAVQLLVNTLNDWPGYPNRYGEFIGKHEFVRDLLAECDAAYRSDMYYAIRGRVNFALKPLHDYEAMMHNRINGLISKGAARVEGQAPKPIEVGGKKYAPARNGLATHGLATLHCQHCWKKKRFIADTPVGALIKARDSGWKRMPEKWTCPGCVKKLSVTVPSRLAQALVN